VKVTGRWLHFAADFLLLTLIGHGHGYGYGYGLGHGHGIPSPPAFWDAVNLPRFDGHLE